MSEQKSSSETAEIDALMRAVACFEPNERIKGRDKFGEVVSVRGKTRDGNSIDIKRKMTIMKLSRVQLKIAELVRKVWKRMF
ncbi:MAG: hypothetical protein FWF87_00010 [Synergistaceae bacterium]|nr:hypothetical protein [Synergistaceae bacterium]